MTGNRIVYVGHATTLIEIDGVRLLTDPVLGGIAHIRRIAGPPTADLTVDGILLSHGHHDHLDLKSLRSLPQDPPILAPPGVAAMIRRRTRHRTIETPVGERVRIKSVEVLATEAVHDSRRTPAGKPLGAVGFVVEGSARVYFAGDTDLFDGMAGLAEGIDVALLPVWGWGPKVGPGHMDPERAARAAALLQPSVAVPIHWGTLASPRVWWRDDPGQPAREFERLAGVHAPGVSVRILQPGEEMSF